jgi:hypothetical protein
MRKRRVAAVAVLALSVAGCAQDASPPPASAPAAAAPQSKTDERLPQDAADQIAQDAADRLEKDLNALEAPRADATRRQPAFARATLDGWEVLHEARQEDVRDTRRVYDEKRGAMAEVPADGTVNPSRVLQNEEWAKKAEALAHREAVLLAATHTRFRELFAEPLRLPPLPADRLPLSAEVLWNRASFDDEMLRAGTPVASFVRAIRRPGTTGFVTYAGDESLQSLDEWVCAGGRVQKESDQTLATACSAQLLREYAGVRRGERIANDDPSALGPLWVTRGLAELLGVVEVDRDRLATLDGAGWQHERIALGHVAEARGNRDSAEEWTISRLLLIRTTEDARDLARHVEHDSSMEDLFDVRAWALCHFLWHYDGGKYRDRFIAFVGRVLNGTGTSEAFAKEIMSRPSLDDWGEIEMEFEWYWMQLLSRKVGRDRQTHEWYEPSTDPPSGTVDKDEDFREIWAERHPAAAPRPK